MARTMTNQCQYFFQLLSFWIKHDLDRSTTYPKFDLTGVRTHGRPPDYDSTFYVTETPALTTRVYTSEIYTFVKYKHLFLTIGIVA